MTKTPLRIQLEITEEKTRYRFILKPRRQSSLEFILRDDYGVPYFQKRYRIQVNNRIYEGSTGGDGIISQLLPATAKSAELTVWLDDSDPEDTLNYQLDLAPLPPIEEIRGIQMRLKNLGYDIDDITDELDEPTQLAIQSFQEFMGHAKATGEVNEKTRLDLKKMHEGE